jgi:23S rRNA (uracil1939-C5)-methyltransferase
LGVEKVEQGQIIKAKIETLAGGGQGIARVDGMTIFVDNSVPGDELEIRIVEAKSHYCRAKIHKIIVASPFRVQPPCKYFEKCGACDMQHIDYGAQLKFKEQIVKDTMRKIGGISPDLVQPVIGMENPWGYRNKVQYPVREGSKFQVQSSKFKVPSSKKVMMGYFKKGTHEIVDIDNCLVLHPFLNKISNAVKKLIEDFKIPVYDEDRGNGLIRHVLARVGFASKEAILCLVSKEINIPGSRNLVNALTKSLEQEENGFILKGVVINENRRSTNVILGKKTKRLWGEEKIKEKLGSLEFRISAQSFFQVNPVQTLKLYSVVEGFAALTGKETVLDLYCGTGSISLWLAKKAKEVWGVEENKFAIDDAKENARSNGIKNAFFKCGTSESVIRQFLDTDAKFDVVVLDPPRSGCSQGVIESIIKLKPSKIVYVSCDPATLARDLKLFSERYKTVKIQPVDMFPQTAHIECVAYLSR